MTEQGQMIKEPPGGWNGWRNWMQSPPPMRAESVEAWRSTWSEVIVIEPWGPGNEAMNIYGLYWRPVSEASDDRTDIPTVD